jgi:hypothetical protein
MSARSLVLRLVNTVSYRVDALGRFPSRCQGLAGGFLVANARDLRPLAAGSARRNFRLSAGHSSTLGGTLLNILLEIGMSPECPPAAWNPPLRPLAPGATNGYVAVFMKRST